MVQNLNEFSRECEAQAIHIYQKNTIMHNLYLSIRFMYIFDTVFTLKIYKLLVFFLNIK